MLVSLREDKARKLARVMANPTCTRILDHLAQKETTESAMARELGIPISTVHYDLQQLVQAKLVVVEEFHYSPKGREVNHYKLANKYIIIAPKEDSRILDRLRKLIPAAILTFGAAAALKAMQYLAPLIPTDETMKAASEGVLMLAAEAAPVPWWQGPMVDWFIGGAVFVLAVLVIGELVAHWRRG